MARKRSKREELPSVLPYETTGSRSREVLGLALLLVALALCFALFSFEAGDDSGRRNLVGPLGASVASMVLRSVGVVGYGAGLAALGFAGIVLFGRIRWPSFSSTLAVMSILLGGTILAHLSAVQPDLMPYPPGGLVGLVAGDLLKSRAGPAGAVLAAIGLVSIGLVIVLRLSLRAAVNTAMDRLQGALASMWQQHRIRRDAQRAAHARQRELLDADREERAEEARKTRLQEQARQRALEEQARVAVLEATAAAEQQARAQIERDRKKRGGKRATPKGAGSTPVTDEEQPVPLVPADRKSGRPDAVSEPAVVIPLSGRGSGSGVDSVPGLSTPIASDPALYIDASIVAADPSSLENAADVVDRIDRGALVLDAPSEPGDIAEASGPPSGKPTLEIIDESPPPSV
ncbi:MAG: DNA translocase FtsK 4TM domain-containing protein, partial [Myxococcota bacterium]